MVGVALLPSQAPFPNPKISPIVDNSAGVLLALETQPARPRLKALSIVGAGHAQISVCVCEGTNSTRISDPNERFPSCHPSTLYRFVDQP